MLTTVTITVFKRVTQTERSPGRRQNSGTWPPRTDDNVPRAGLAVSRGGCTGLRALTTAPTCSRGYPGL